MTNNLFHKDCPIPRNRKLQMVLRHEVCSQMEPLNTTGFGMKENWLKMNKNWDYRDPNSSKYNFPELCENCSKNVIWGYLDIFKIYGTTGTSQSAANIIIMDEIEIPLFRRVLARIKYFCNIVWYNSSVRKNIQRRIKNDKND